MRRYGHYWNVLCQNDRRFRSKDGRVITYQCMVKFVLDTEWFKRAFARLEDFCQQLKVPQGCIVELPPLFSYCIEELYDPDSPWWVVAYTEVDSKTGAFLLFEFHLSCRLCALSKPILEGIRRLNLRRECRRVSVFASCNRAVVFP